MAERQRSHNWSENEIRTLVEWTVNSYDLLFGKFSAQTTSECKDAKWKEIAEAVCAVGFVNRPVEKVNKKWRELKSLTKMKERKIREARKRTGGGPVPPSLKDWEEKIVSVLPDCVVEGVEFSIDCFEESEVSVGDMLLERTDDEIQCHLSLENFLQSTITPATLAMQEKALPRLQSCKENIIVQETDKLTSASTSGVHGAGKTQSGRSAQLRSNSRKRSCDCDMQLVDIQKGLLEESKKRNILLEKILQALEKNKCVLISDNQQSS